MLRVTPSFITSIKTIWNLNFMNYGKYPFLLANSSHKYIWELYVLAKYGNFVLNIQNFEKTPQTFLNEYQKSNWFLKKKVICQNSSQTVLTPAIIWELFAKKSADRPNCHYSSVTFSKIQQVQNLIWTWNSRSGSTLFKTPFLVSQLLLKQPKIEQIKVKLK